MDPKISVQLEAELSRLEAGLQEAEARMRAAKGTLSKAAEIELTTEIEGFQDDISDVEVQLRELAEAAETAAAATEETLAEVGKVKIEADPVGVDASLDKVEAKIENKVEDISKEAKVTVTAPVSTLSHDLDQSRELVATTISEMDGDAVITIGANSVQAEATLEKIDEATDRVVQGLEKRGAKAVTLFAAKMAKIFGSIGALGAVLRRASDSVFEGITAQESGLEIMERIGKGLVEGGKTVPIAGTIIAWVEFGIYGAEEAAKERAAALGRAMGEAVVTGIESQKAAAKSAFDFGVMVKDILAEGEGREGDRLRLQTEARLRSLKESFDAQAAIEQKFIQDGIAAGTNVEQLEKQSRARMLRMERDYAAAKFAIESDLINGLAKMKEDADKKVTDDARKAEAEALASAEEAQNAILELEREAREKASREKADIDKAYLAGLQDQIDAMTKASQPSRAERLGGMIETAAAALVNRGDTVLGAYSFAGGEAKTALSIATQQLDRLERIEALQEEMREYQRNLSRNVGVS